MPLNTARSVMDSGTYFTANNGATGVATTATPTSFSDTAPLFTIQNGNANNTGRSIYLDWVRGYNTAAGTAGVDLRLKLELDRITPTAGTVCVSYGTNANDPYVQSGAVVRILPTGIAATANMRLLIGQAIVIPTQAAVFTVGTEFNLKFGGADGFVSPSVAVASQAAITTRQMPPVVIPPGWTLQVPFLATSQSAASSWAFEFGWVEF
jgi:hypothetical protein